MRGPTNIACIQSRITPIGGLLIRPRTNVRWASRSGTVFISAVHGQPTYPFIRPIHMHAGLVHGKSASLYYMCIKLFFFKVVLAQCAAARYFPPRKEKILYLEIFLRVIRHFLPIMEMQFHTLRRKLNGILACFSQSGARRARSFTNVRPQKNVHSEKSDIGFG